MAFARGMAKKTFAFAAQAPRHCFFLFFFDAGFFVSLGNHARGASAHMGEWLQKSPSGIHHCIVT